MGTLKDTYYERSKNFFNKVAKTSYGNSQKLDELALSEVNQGITTKNNPRVLDFGCGDGRFIQLLEASYPDLNIECVGIDISKEMLQLANKRGTRGVFHLIDDYDFGALGKFDYIIALNSFHHVSTPRDLIASFNNILKERGEIVIGEVYTPPLIRGLVNSYLPYSKKGDYRMYSSRELKELFTQGKITENNYQVSYFNFTFIQSFTKGI